MGLLMTPFLMPLSQFRSWLPLFMRILPWEMPAWPWTVATLGYVPLATAMIAACAWQLWLAAREAERNWVTDP